jgi:hypothetical protein
VPPLHDADSTRIDEARKLGTILVVAGPVLLPLLVPSAAVVPLVPVAGFVAAGWLVVGFPVALAVPGVPLVGEAVPAVAVVSELSILPLISTR